MESVRPPRPMDVKKLMAKRRLACVSLGKMPSYHSWQVLSLMRSFSLTRPRVLDSSYTERAGREFGRGTSIHRLNTRNSGTGPHCILRSYSWGGAPIP